ncbi:DoxX family protein [Bradyrhizobium sp.]|uniref:DoxX family protein n=1 Tax=Bradyrhizobium sp. TaxID=376 RepID=UPI0025C5C902|nr:DoxX family protein [Bradyrhizobium sp.]MBV8923092.1 DoxX family protein [Bradyrhizobium sp.]
MLMLAEFLPLLDPKFLTQIFRLVCREFGSTALSRRLSGPIILSMRLFGLIELALRALVAETAHRMSHGSSGALAPRLDLISILCAVLCAVPLISIPGAILIAGCLGAAQVWHTRGEAMLPVCMLFGICAALLVWDGPCRRARDLGLLRTAPRRNCCLEN